MKFALNGALTIGTPMEPTSRSAASGAENFFLFGLNAEVSALKG